MVKNSCPECRSHKIDKTSLDNDEMYFCSGCFHLFPIDKIEKRLLRDASVNMTNVIVFLTSSLITFVCLIFLASILLKYFHLF